LFSFCRTLKATECRVKLAPPEVSPPSAIRRSERVLPIALLVSLRDGETLISDEQSVTF
jgi:hypothetical protein